MARDAEKQVSATAASHYVTLGLKKTKQEYSVKLILKWIMDLKSF